MVRNLFLPRQRQYFQELEAFLVSRCPHDLLDVLVTVGRMTCQVVVYAAGVVIEIDTLKGCHVSQ